MRGMPYNSNRRICIKFLGSGKLAGVDTPIDRNPDYYIDVDGGVAR